MKMQSVKFFKNKPVKHMRRGVNGIILTMLSAIKGQAGTQLTVSQADWDLYGEVRKLPAGSNDRLRSFV